MSGDDLYEQRRDMLHERAIQTKAQAIQLAWEAKGDPNLEAAASHLLTASRFLSRAAAPVESAKAS